VRVDPPPVRYITHGIRMARLTGKEGCLDTLSLTPSIPADGLPLSYSGNPGVKRRISQGGLWLVASSPADTGERASVSH
jgi:hypothetical protein